MKLYQEMMTKILSNEVMEVSFPNFNVNPSEVLEMQCYKALSKIKLILEDETLNDAECFDKIEEIICVFEELGTHSIYRHDK